MKNINYLPFRLHGQYINDMLEKHANDTTFDRNSFLTGLRFAATASIVGNIHADGNGDKITQKDFEEIVDFANHAVMNCIAKREEMVIVDELKAMESN